MISGQQVFFSSNLGGQNIFFSPKCSAGNFFSLLISLQDFFPSKVSCLHLHCGYCSNSSNMELQSLKIL